MNQIADRLASFIVKTPMRAFGIAIAFLMITIPGLSHLKTDFSYRIWFRESDPMLQRFDAFERRFGNDDQSLIAIHSPSGIFDEDSIRLIQELTEKMWLVPETIRVDSLVNYNWVHATGDDIIVDPFIPDDQKLTTKFLAQRASIAAKDETIPNYLVSKDQKTALIYVTVQPKMDGTPDYQLISAEIAKVLEGYKTRSDHKIYQSGAVSLTDGFRESTETDFATLTPIILAIIILFLVISFRSIGGVAISLFVVFTTILSTLGILGWVGIKINNTTAIVPQILIAIAVADAVHILVNYFRALRGGMDRKEAIRYSLVKNFRPTVLTTLSTSIGFFSFSSAKIVPILQMGISSGMGTMIAWFLTYFALGPLVSFFPIRGFKSAKTRGVKEISPLALRYADFLERHATKILVAGGLIFAGTLTLTLRNEVNSDPFKYFSPRFPLTIATDFIEEHVGGGMGAEFVINSGVPEGAKDPAFLAKVDQFQTWVDDHGFVTKTVSILDVLKSMNRSLHGDKQEYYKLPDTKEAVAQLLLLYSMSLPQGMDVNNRITVDNDSVRLTALWTLHESKQVLETVKAWEAKGKELGLDVHVTGKMPLYQSMNGFVVDTFVISLSLAVFLISLLMAYALGSVKMGMVSLFPNLLPLLMGGAVIWLLGIYMDVGTVVVGSICLGIAVDDTIHFVANYVRLRRDGMGARDAVASVFTHTAPALTVTTIVLVASFGTFLFALFVPNYNMGRMVAVILSFALFADFTLLPALLLKLRHRKTAT